MGDGGGVDVQRLHLLQRLGDVSRLDQSRTAVDGQHGAVAAVFDVAQLVGGLLQQGVGVALLVERLGGLADQLHTAGRAHQKGQQQPCYAKKHVGSHAFIGENGQRHQRDADRRGDHRRDPPMAAKKSVHFIVHVR